ncbi:MAG: DUF1553 domain-containing protein [Gemmataceae bacterium]
MLAASSKLDTSLGGRPVDLFKRVQRARSVYGFIDRSNLPGTFRVFDLASPDQHSPQRFQTTVPQQALFLMNSPFVIEQAKSLAARSPGSGPARVKSLYRHAARPRPDRIGAALAMEFTGTAPSTGEFGSGNSWPKCCC